MGRFPAVKHLNPTNSWKNTYLRCKTCVCTPPFRFHRHLTQSQIVQENNIMTIYRQKRKSFHIDSDGFNNDSIKAAAELSSLERDQNTHDSLTTPRKERMFLSTLIRNRFNRNVDRDPLSEVGKDREKPQFLSCRSSPRVSQFSPTTPRKERMILSTLVRNRFNRNADRYPLSEVLKDREKPQLLSCRSVSLGNSSGRTGLHESHRISFPSVASAPIVSALSDQPFQDLYIKSSPDGIVLVDSTREESAIAAVIKSRDNKFTIYSCLPNNFGQAQVNLVHYKEVYRKLHTHATVERVGKVLEVVLEGNCEPTYTIHKVQNETNRDFYTKHVIKKHGELVASSRHGPERSYTLESVAGADVVMMILLSAIGDDVSGQHEESSLRRRTIIPKNLIRWSLLMAPIRLMMIILSAITDKVSRKQKKSGGWRRFSS